MSGMEEATREHFFQHASQVPPSIQANCHFCQLLAFPTQNTYPVSIVNTTGDGATLPRGFRFINESVLTRGVELAGAEFLSGCRCKDSRHCQYATCMCQDELSEEFMDGAGGKALAYHTDERGTSVGQRLFGDASADARTNNAGGGNAEKVGAGGVMGVGSTFRKAGLLRSAYLNSRQPIYECHAACACTLAECPNRVVQRGRTIPLQIFRTDDGRGWGVRSSVDIRRGQFIDRYLGEILMADVADERRQRSNRSQGKDVYLFALDKFIDEDSQDPRLRGDPVEVDGEYMSGPTRFINHSCDPNLRIFACVGDHANKHVHDLALFAIKEIPRLTELTFDYVDGEAEEKLDAHNKALQGFMTRCMCKSKNCRGYLW